MKVKSGFALLGAVAVIGGFALLAKGQSQAPYNSVLDGNPPPVVKTAYTGGATAPGAATATAPAIAQPVDFEKAATAAVPAVVHIKTMMKFKQTASREMPGQGQGQGPDQ